MAELLLPEGAYLTHEIEVKRSRFLALVARVATVDEARSMITARRADMPDARHHCNAFIVSIPGANAASHSSDDGEPSGTAGRPMLDVLAGTGLVDVVAVVTRYFGGTLLGTGGLVRAYSDAVRECLEGAAIVERRRLPLWEATLPHADAGRYLAEFASAGFGAEPDYLAEGVRIAVAAEDSGEVSTLLAQLSSGKLSFSPAGERVTEVPVGALVGGRPMFSS